MVLARGYVLVEFMIQPKGSVARETMAASFLANRDLTYGGGLTSRPAAQTASPL